MVLAGVDGCRAGWIAALTDASSFRLMVFARFSDIAACVGPGGVIAVDMPIGLPARSLTGGREPERAVRSLLGMRKSSVFSVPSRSAVEVGADFERFPESKERYVEACRVARSTSAAGRAVSKQSFCIFPKILEVDGYVRSINSAPVVIETHPEVVFWRLNGERPLAEPKKRKGAIHEAGMVERRSLLLGAGIPEEVVRQTPPWGAAADDALDALAAVTVARGYVGSSARCFPPMPDRDAHGIPMAIWA